MQRKGYLSVEAHNDPTHTDPEGESLADFTRRVTETCINIIAEGTETAIVLAHGGSLKVILKHLNQPIPDKIGDGEIIEIDLST